MSASEQEEYRDGKAKEDVSAPAPEMPSSEEAHRRLAIERNQEVWALLGKPDRTKADDERMVFAAHASLQHWRVAGTGLHHQPGEWLLARVYSELGDALAALRHAERCLELTERFADAVEDFDRAYAYEAVARAHAVAGKTDEARRYHRLAEEAGKEIRGEEDRRIFQKDLHAGDWHGSL